MLYMFEQRWQGTKWLRTRQTEQIWQHARLDFQVQRWITEKDKPIPSLFSSKLAHVFIHKQELQEDT